MKLKIFVLLLITLAFSELKAGPWQIYTNYEDAGLNAAKMEALKTSFDTLKSDAFMVIRNGRVAASWGDIYRRYMLHSLRNNLIHSLYGYYVTQAKIDTNLTLEQLGVDRLDKLSDQEKKAKIIDLLAMRSGVYYDAAYESPSARASKPARDTFQVGTHFYMNNWDSNVLGQILETGFKEDFFKIFMNKIARNIGMQDFRLIDGYHHWEVKQSYFPAFPMKMSARDLARFGVLYLNKGKWGGQRVFSEEWYNLSTYPRSTELGSFSQVFSGCGLMWWLPKGELAKYNAIVAVGAGGHYLAVIPGADMVIVNRMDSYANKGMTYVDFEKMCLQAVKAIDKDANPDAPVEYLPDNPKKIDMAEIKEEDLQKYMGNYRFAWGDMAINREANFLVMESPNWGIYRLLPVSDTKFIIEDMESPLEFEFDEKGEVQTLSMKLRNDQVVKAYKMPDAQEDKQENK